MGQALRHGSPSSMSRDEATTLDEMRVIIQFLALELGQDDRPALACLSQIGFEMALDVLSHGICSSHAPSGGLIAWESDQRLKRIIQ